MQGDCGRVAADTRRTARRLSLSPPGSPPPPVCLPASSDGASYVDATIAACMNAHACMHAPPYLLLVGCLSLMIF